MKKIWNQYSYAIILLLLSCTLAFVLAFQQSPKNQDKYLKVTVTDGDTLWEISQKYAGEHSLSNKEFVNWVKKHNRDVGDEIFPGEEILIPVSNEAPVERELASALEK